jgi:4-hydroxybenzoate polyprenyltransferase
MISRPLARRLTAYAELLRLNRPIGTWLLLWPVLWALWIAGDGTPVEKVFLIFVLGVLVMRAAGCVVNDFADRDIDPRVKRTRDRPLASRRLSPYEAIAIFLILIAIALALVSQLDELTIKLSVVGALLTVSYPLMKRWFPLPQFYLGLSFGGWGIPMAFAATQGGIPRVGWVLFIAAVLWAMVYDTIYAMIDREDDLKLGIKSSAILFADLDKLIVGVMQAMMLYALYVAGQMLELGGWFRAGLVAAAVLFAWQQWLIRAREPASCFRAFLNNNYVGMALFIGVLLDYTFRIDAA